MSVHKSAYEVITFLILSNFVITITVTNTVIFIITSTGTAYATGARRFSFRLGLRLSAVM